MIKNDDFYPGLNPRTFVYKAATVPLLHTEMFYEITPFTFLIVKPNNKLQSYLSQYNGVVYLHSEYPNWTVRL